MRATRLLTVVSLRWSRAAISLSDNTIELAVRILAPLD
jgi:hypothetical protein